MEIDLSVMLAGIFLAIVFLGLIIGSVAVKLGGFLDELRYVNMEIRRAGPRERATWCRRRRRLWLSLLPFVKK